MGWLERQEIRALRWITCEWESPLVDTAAELVNHWVFGTCVYVILFLLVATRARGRARLPRAALTTLLALGLSHAVLFATWRLAPRARPGEHFPEDRTLRGHVQRASCGEHPDMWVERSHPPK